MKGPRPKTLLITSSVPNEGKSTISSNLAITMALSGARTLLIDGDLRRGAIREAFGISSKIGFSEVLKQEVNWREVVVPTSYPNLFLLPRGKTLAQPSEHLLRDSTDSLLKEIYNHYDYIIIDSSPVLAADDSTSLAPKIDATLFVVRLSYTSARLTRKSLELLYNRQVNVPGVILNFVDTSLPEYYYYQYSEYYNTPAPVEEQMRRGIASHSAETDSILVGRAPISGPISSGRSRCGKTDELLRHDFAASPGRAWRAGSVQSSQVRPELSSLSQLVSAPQ